jgi:predicted RNase H-like HicB family nuclease
MKKTNKALYPVVFTQIEDGWYMASVPDFPLDTQGEDLEEAIFMARDAIGLMGITLQDDGKAIPKPSRIQDITCEPGEFVSLVDIDFEAYRRIHEKSAVRRNVSLPNWLNEAADQAGLNVSAVLQTALKLELKLTEDDIPFLGALSYENHGNHNRVTYGKAAAAAQGGRTRV